MNLNHARLLRSTLAAWLMVTALAGTAVAGSFEDGSTAFERGDYATAMRLWRPLADQGQAEAQYKLGLMYEKGQGVPQDYAEAMRWYRKAADQGDADAQFNLGSMYDAGQNVPQDYAEAMKWYGRAADQGDAAAQFNLGFIYANGRGVPKDYAEAAKWYRRAADQGDAGAQINLGVMYALGEGVPGDYAEAAKWYRKAASQGDAHAQINLGVMYEFGEGVPQDYIQAHKWYNLAATGFSASMAADREMAVKNRDRVAAQMTSAQIAEAQKLAREWPFLRAAEPLPAQGAARTLLKIVVTLLNFVVSIAAGVAGVVTVIMITYCWGCTIGWAGLRLNRNAKAANAKKQMMESFRVVRTSVIGLGLVTLLLWLLGRQQDVKDIWQLLGYVVACWIIFMGVGVMVEIGKTAIEGGLRRCRGGQGERLP